MRECYQLLSEGFNENKHGTWEAFDRKKSFGFSFSINFIKVDLIRPEMSELCTTYNIELDLVKKIFYQEYS